MVEEIKGLLKTLGEFSITERKAEFIPQPFFSFQVKGHH